MLAGIAFLAYAGTPEAVAGLQACYACGVHRGESDVWLALCESLAAKGDARGLTDAFETLVRLEQIDDPPAGDKERRNWTSARDSLRRRAEHVFSSVSKELLAAFLVRKSDATAREQQRAILSLLWTLPTVPPEFAPVLTKWSASSDVNVKKSALRLLDQMR